MAGKQQKDKQYIVRALLKYIPETEIIQTTKYILKQNKYQEDVSFEAKSRLCITQQNIENYTNMNKAKETLLEGKADKLKVDVNNSLNSIVPKYGIGDQFLELHDIQALDIETNTSKPSSWLPKAGIITLAYFWAIEFPESYYYMPYMSLLFNQFQDQIGKLELFGFCLNNESESILEKVKEYSVACMNHFYFTNGWKDQSLILNCLNIAFKSDENIPLAVLFNQQGQIVSIERFNILDSISQKIQELLEPSDKQDIQQQIVQQEPLQYTLLNKDDFKLLKGRIRSEVQQFLKGLHLRKSTIEISLTKSNMISSTRIVPFQKTQAVIDYRVQNDEKAKLDEFLKLIHDLLPAEMISFGTTTTFDDPEHRKVLQDVCKNNGVQVQYLNKRISNYKYVNSDQPLKLEIISEDAIRVQQTSPKIVDNIFTEIENSMSSAQYQQFARSYNPVKDKIIYSIKSSINDKYIPIKSYLKVETQVIETIFHKQGQILVICYYEQYKSNKRIISTINTMFKMNKANWGDTVRVVVLSRYYEYQKFLRTTQQLNELEFYEQIKDYPEDRILYRVRLNPHCVIVDAEGLIQHMGQCTEMEGILQNLLHPQQQVQPKNLSHEQIKQLQKLLECIKDAFSGLGNKFTFEFKLQFKAVYENEYGDAEFLKANQPTLKYWVKQGKLEQLNLILSKIFEIVPKEQFKLTETISRTFDVPFPGQQCVVCKGVLTDQVPQYYSPFKNEFICAPCAEFDDKAKIGLARFKYTDTLIFINAPLKDLSQLKGIDEFKIGKNNKIAIGEPGNQKHKIHCKMCYRSTSQRYISLSARPGKLKQKSWRNDFGRYYDFCQECFNHLKDKNSKKAQEIFERKEKSGLSPDGLFVRILFNTGYYEF